MEGNTPAYMPGANPQGAPCGDKPNAAGFGRNVVVPFRRVRLNPRMRKLWLAAGRRTKGLETATNWEETKIAAITEAAPPPDSPRKKNYGGPHGRCP